MSRNETGSTPCVSVLLPVRDARHTLPACLRSIARQTSANFECVVVDDGSIDGSAACVRATVGADARFVVLQQPARGIVPALHAGVAACRGAFVARMDADDVMHRDRLRLQLAAFARSPGLGLVGTHVRLFPRAGLQPGRLAYETWLNGLCEHSDIRRDALVECPLAHPTWMARAEVARAFPYREVPWAEDYDVLLRLLRAGVGVGVVPRRLLLWRDHPSRLSRTHPRYAQDAFVQAKADALCNGFLAGHARYVLWGHGHTGKAIARALAGLGRSPAAIVELHPGRLGNRIRGAPVIPPQRLAAWRALPLVVSVAGAQPRAEIRATLAAMRYAEGRDFVCVA